MTEEEFLRSNPRKIGALWKLHSKFNGWIIEEESKHKKVYIDEIPFL